MDSSRVITTVIMRAELADRLANYLQGHGPIGDDEIQEAYEALTNATSWMKRD